MKLPLAYYGNPILRKKCSQIEKIDEEIRQFVKDMTDTLIEHNGLGLAAPQVHRDLRLFITAVPVEQPDGKWQPGQLRIFINPTIVSVSEETNSRSEGCLSIPALYLEVTRPEKVTVRATDREGKIFEEEFSGLEARCILHENDHINGVLFIDRIPKKMRKDIEPKLKEIKEKNRT